MRNSTERGIAMITTLLVLMLMSALLVGFTTIVMSDQRYRFIDRDRGQAFYAASGGIEKLTADLGNLFLEYVAPTAAQITALTAAAKLPVIAGITYTDPANATPAALPSSLLTSYHCSAGGKTTPLVGTNGYTIRFCADAAGKPTPADDANIITGTGAYAGLVGLQTPYQLDVTAKTTTGGEVHLIRTIQSVAIPVFQFGMFSDSDLSFYARENFTFGGRIHTNGNLWLAEGNGNTLITTAKMTAFKDVIRQYLSNGVTLAVVLMSGTVNLATASGAPVGNRNLLATEGSVVGMPGSAVYGSWQGLSLNASPLNYNGYLRNVATGAKKLSLPLTAPGVGGTNADLVRRPVAGEDTAGILYNERLFTKASLRILLSDTAADITNIPGVTATAPVNLENNWNTAAPNNGTAYGPVSGVTGLPPIALSPGNQLTNTTAAVAVGNTIQAPPIPYFLPATLTVGFGGPVVQNNVVCTERVINVNLPPMVSQFKTCTLAVATIATGQPVTATINGQTVSTTLAAPWAVGTSTISVPNGATGAFANGTLWLKPTVGQPMLVSCAELYVAIPQFRSCAGVTAAASLGAAITTSALSTSGTGTTGGYIKIEKSDAAGTWTDVTMEILNYGIGGLNLGGQICNAGVELSPNAIIRLQRLKDNAGGTSITNGGGCNYATDTTGYRDPMNWWPNVLFDTREGVQRDVDPGTSATGLPLGGVMYYVTVDAGNLAKWFKATAGFPYVAGTGATARTDNGGYTLYFSDRRNNRNAASLETAEFGWEDFVNSGVATGAPNAVCELPGEDVNENLTCETYGKTPNYNGVYNANVPGAAVPLNNTAVPTTLVYRGQAQVNRPIIFRRALKLVNGGTLGSDATVANRITGLTVVSENPVYIQGDWNAAATFAVADLHAATSVIADAVSILSNAWNDNFSFAVPYTYVAGGRLRSVQSYYRVAILGGKGPSFTKPSDVAAASVFGTDGGAHNFLRMLEADGGVADTVNYRGSMATLFYSRQGIGVFKCCSGGLTDGIVYSVPTRNFIFDTDFLVPALLPPNTPMFRDMNAVGFSQELRPGK